MFIHLLVNDTFRLIDSLYSHVAYTTPAYTVVDGLTTIIPPSSPPARLPLWQVLVGKMHDGTLTCFGFAKIS